MLGGPVDDYLCPTCGMAGVLRELTLNVVPGQTPDVTIPVACPACGGGPFRIEMRRDVDGPPAPFVPEPMVGRWPWITCDACSLDVKMFVGGGPA